MSSEFTEEVRLPVPDPRQLTRSLLDLPEQLLGRVTGLLDGADRVVRRIELLLDRIEGTRLDAAAVVLRVDAVAADAAPLLRRVTLLVDRFEPPLLTLHAVVQRLADTTSQEEVDALVSVIDHAPEVVRRLEEELLPIMATMGSVAPDIHDLLDVSRELNEMLVKLPGMGRIKKRVEAEQDD